MNSTSDDTLTTSVDHPITEITEITMFSTKTTLARTSASSAAAQHTTTTTTTASPDSVCRTVKGAICQFPLQHRGTSWFSCLPWNGSPWCATSLTRAGTWGSWDYCDPTSCNK